MNMSQNYSIAGKYPVRYLKFDLIASVVVFLVAIPLCLGIALASGAPLFSGILSGIIGGIIVGIFSQSQVSVSGPAAGMAAVVFAAITQLGDFNTFLLALFLAGALQFIVGYLKVGFVADYIPSNVIQGLLCAIGLLLIIKQLPLAFTHSLEISSLRAHLLDTTEGFALKPLLDIGTHLNPGAILITVLSMAILIFFDKTKKPILKDIPSAIIVVIIGVILNEAFILSGSNLEQTTPQLVNIPTSSNFEEFVSLFQFPAWGMWTNPKVYIYAFVLAAVASLESLLNLKASERLDKKRRYSSKNKELIAQGLGNMSAGLVGGIPVTSVIVRTSVNVQAGAKTKLSAISHGFLILFSVMLFPEALNKIPLSSLAAILIHIGYKLTHPSIYKTLYQQGKDRFIPFIVTVSSIIIFNLLTGVLIGLGCSLYYLLKSHGKTRFDLIKEYHPSGIVHRLILPQQVSFLNKASLIAELNTLPDQSKLIIDACDTNYMDKEIIELIKDFKQDRAKHKRIEIKLVGFKDEYVAHDYIDYINVTTYDLQQTLSPEEVLNILKEGNQRFLNDTRIHRNPKTSIPFTADSQYPLAVVLGCIDSRVPVELIFDMSFGDIFCIRVAGNVVNDDVLASMEYACSVAGAKLILVLGHVGCGAIQAACNDVKKGHISQLLAKIKPAIQSLAKLNKGQEKTIFDDKTIKQVTELNISHTLLQIYKQSEILHNMLKAGDIAMAGALYDIHSGKVHFEDYSEYLQFFDGETSKELEKQLSTFIGDSNISTS